VQDAFLGSSIPLRFNGFGSHLSRLSFHDSASQCASFRSQRHAVGRAVQETAERRLLADPGGVASENKEGSLESVLGILQIVQDAMADAQNHRAMSMNQGEECGIVAAEQELIQEAAITPVGQRAICKEPLDGARRRIDLDG
jgi:hypothetical protein